MPSAYSSLSTEQQDANVLRASKVIDWALTRPPSEWRTDCTACRGWHRRRIAGQRLLRCELGRCATGQNGAYERRDHRLFGCPWRIDT